MCNKTVFLFQFSYGNKDYIHNYYNVYNVHIFFFLSDKIKYKTVFIRIIFTRILLCVTFITLLSVSGIVMKHCRLCFLQCFNISWPLVDTLNAFGNTPFTISYCGILTENVFDTFKLVDGTVNYITTAITGRKMASIFTAAALLKK